MKEKFSQASIGFAQSRSAAPWSPLVAMPLIARGWQRFSKERKGREGGRV
jgi:hypothetical protein